MVKALFFDWFNTLVYSKPAAQEIYCQAYREFGIELNPQKILKGYALAEKQMVDGNPAKWKESEDEETYIRYQEILLTEIGVKVSRDVISKAIRNIRRMVDELTMVLYDDTLPALNRLKQQGLILGLLTNMQEGMRLNHRELGLEPYLDFVVTSEEAGANKPEPPIFLLALEKAKVSAHEAVYVGDQYGTDVLGAKRTGINPVLLDRYDLAPNVSDCPRIHSLLEIVDYVSC